MTDTALATHLHKITPSRTANVTGTRSLPPAGVANTPASSGEAVPPAVAPEGTIHGSPAVAALSSAVGLVTSPAGAEGDTDRQPIQPDHPAPQAEVEAVAGEVALPASPAPNVTPLRKRWKLDDPAHPHCLDPAQCGGFSNNGLCQRCKASAGLPYTSESAA